LIQGRLLYCDNYEPRNVPEADTRRQLQLIEINVADRAAQIICSMKAQFIVNDPPYGTERVYNAIRLAHALLKKDSITQTTVFLMADAVFAAKAQQKTPDDYYNVERMLKQVISNKGTVLLCARAWMPVA